MKARISFLVWSEKLSKIFPLAILGIFFNIQSVFCLSPAEYRAMADVASTVAPTSLAAKFFPEKIKFFKKEGELTGQIGIHVFNPTESPLFNVTLELLDNGEGEISSSPIDGRVGSKVSSRNPCNTGNFHGSKFNLWSEIKVIKKCWKTIPPKHDRLFFVKLKSADFDSVAALPQEILFRINYDRVENPVGLKSTNVIIKPLEVELGVPEDYANVFNVELKTAMGTLDEYHPGDIYVVVKNNASFPIGIGKVRHKEPQGVTISTKNENNEENFIPIKINPFDVGTIPFKVKVDRIQPGKNILLFEVPVNWDSDGLSQSKTVVLSQEVTLGVFGESEVFGLLEIPTIFVLPGFLIISIMRTFWRWKNDEEEEKDKFPFEPATPSFWIIAITLSGIVSSVYSTVMERNYLKGYDFHDLSVIWSISIILGVIFGWMYFGKYRNATTPTNSDSSGKGLDSMTATPTSF